MPSTVSRESAPDYDPTSPRPRLTTAHDGRATWALVVGVFAVALALAWVALEVRAAREAMPVPPEVVIPPEVAIPKEPR